VVTLATFWIAALATKGSALRRRAGAIYLISLIAILVTVSLMLVARLSIGDEETTTVRARCSIAVLVLALGMSTATVARIGSPKPTTALGVPAHVGLGPAASQRRVCGS
jgi:hypothetical protein